MLYYQNLLFNHAGIQRIGKYSLKIYAFLLMSSNTADVKIGPPQSSIILNPTSIKINSFVKQSLKDGWLLDNEDVYQLDKIRKKTILYSKKALLAHPFGILLCLWDMQLHRL